MNKIKVSITAFIVEGQPPLVEARFVDAWNKEHIMHEKVPIFTEEWLDEKSDYPQDGVVACEIIRRWTDETGRTLFTITTEKPWGVETLEGLTEFDVPEEQFAELQG